MVSSSDAPRSLRDPLEVAARRARLRDPHVAPLTDWVVSLRSRLGAGARVPDFDPADGGVGASILWLLEAPGPKATGELGGSGFISCNNHDQTAENTWRTRDEAGVPRSEVVHWNVIPYYLGTGHKIAPWSHADVTAVGPLLSELLDLLPRVRAVILGGKAAQTAWDRYAGAPRGIEVFRCPHTSPLSLNTNPAARQLVVEAWQRAKTTGA